MSINELGRKGEELARLFLKDKGFALFQADWIGKKDGNYTVFEVKHKERFLSPPFDGHGLDVRQVTARLQFYKETGIRCCFVVFEPDSNEVLTQWLDVLEAGEKFTTKNNVRIYPIENFHKQVFSQSN